MRQKRMIVGLVGIVFALGTMAQTKALKVESPMVTEKDFMWYVEQKNVWKDVVRRNPLDEVAWQNYYNAARYMSWYNQEDTTARQVVREMEATIPDSYTFNFCAYRESSSGKGFGDPKVYAEAALARLPEELQFFDYDNWVSYLAMQGDETRMSQMAKKYFNSGIYSEDLLRYNYNEFQGMDEGGIVISNGDVSIIPKWLIQEGMGRHKDKTVVCLSFLAVKEYREWLFRKLGIEQPELKEPQSSEDYDSNEQALIQAIIDHFGSKVYFSTTMAGKSFEAWDKNLYNEGLLLKYSKKPYDNLAVKRRNVEENYLLEYLLVPFRPDWITGQRLTANYAVVLTDLLSYYRKHNKQRYEWLMRLLVCGVTNTSLSEEHKQTILNVLATS